MVSYPDNLTYKDFLLFLLHPVFCYETNYPVSKAPLAKRKFLLRLLLMFSLVMTTHIVCIEQLHPVIHALRDGETIHLMTALTIPATVLYLLAVLILFEISTNIYADISGFEDR